MGGVHVAAHSAFEAESGTVKEGEAVGTPWEDVVVDGVVELLGVLQDGNECVLDILLSLAVMGGECGSETVDETGPVDVGEVVVAAGSRGGLLAA